MALLPQLVTQYDGSGRAQLGSQYAESVAPGSDLVATPNSFDSAMGTSSIANASQASPVVTITPYNPSQVPGWMQVHLRYTGCTEKTPEFRVDMLNWRQEGGNRPAEHRMVWRYVDDASTGVNGRPRPWVPFDNGADVDPHVFSHNTAFTQDEVEVAFKPVWMYRDFENVIAYLDSTAFAFELPSSVAASGLPRHVHAQFTHSGVTSNTAPKVPINMHGIGIEDFTATPTDFDDKLNVVLLVGSHASEDQGDYAGFEAVFNFMNATGPAADWTRAHIRLHVYTVNPQGRYYGQERFTDETGGDEDPNRVWNDNQSEQVVSVRAAHALDATRWDLLVDFHGDYRLNVGTNQRYGGFKAGGPLDDAFFVRMGVNLGHSYQWLGGGATPSAGFSDGYAMLQLSTQLALTAEFPVASAGYPDPTLLYEDFATAYWQSVQDLVGTGDIVGPVNTVLPLGIAAAASAALPFAIAPDQAIALSPAADTSSAQPITVSAETPEQTIALSPATGTSSAQPIAVFTEAPEQTIALSPATDTSSAQPIAIATAGALSLGVATESSLALPLGITRTEQIILGRAPGISAALPINVNVEASVPAGETTLSLGIAYTGGSGPEGDLSAVMTEVALIRKLLTNRVSISADNSVTTIFDDDDNTPLHVFDHPDQRNRVPR